MSHKRPRNQLRLTVNSLGACLLQQSPGVALLAVDVGLQLPGGRQQRLQLCFLRRGGRPGGVRWDAGPGQVRGLQRGGRCVDRLKRTHKQSQETHKKSTKINCENTDLDINLPQKTKMKIVKNNKLKKKMHTLTSQGGPFTFLHIECMPQCSLIQDRDQQAIVCGNSTQGPI